MNPPDKNKKVIDETILLKGACFPILSILRQEEQVCLTKYIKSLYELGAKIEDCMEKGTLEKYLSIYIDYNDNSAIEDWVLMGRRLETDEEYKIRIEKEERYYQKFLEGKERKKFKEVENVQKEKQRLVDLYEKYGDPEKIKKEIEQKILRTETTDGRFNISVD